MSDLQYFFSGLDSFLIENKPYFTWQGIHSSIDVNHGGHFPDWMAADIVLIGCPYSFGCQQESVATAPDTIRSFFYKLAAQLHIADLGNMLPAEDSEDMTVGIATVCERLMRAGKIVVLLGGSQDITLGQYIAYQNLEGLIDYVSVDSKLDLHDAELGLTNRTHNNHIFRHSPHTLYHFTNIGTQNYFVTEDERKTLKALCFESLRMGDIKSNIRKAEPYFRTAHMVSIDFSAVRSADAPGTTESSPAGFSVDEICQLARYMGMGYQLNSLSLTEVCPEYDFRGQTSHLAALTLWYFVEGFYNRIYDQPTANRSNMSCFVIETGDAVVQDLVFFRSEKTNRWWMEVPYPNQEKIALKRTRLVACTEEDYQHAKMGEIPEKWWNWHYKLLEEPR
jgi:arginase family enzyme